jgi:KDO2-lipid IV(A) lauroyltransferase
VLALLSRFLFGLMWLVRLLPIRAVAAIGEAMGSALFWLIPERRHVTRVNLAKCFPHLPQEEREALARAHFRAFMRSFIDRGILWWSRPERVERLVAIEGFEHLQALAGKKVVLLAPHFLGLDAGGVRLSKQWPRMASMYSRQKDPFFDRLLQRGRLRFGGQIYPRQAGIRKVLRAIQGGETFYYLPDMDFGPKASVFVPFFGVPAATTVGLSYISRITGAHVVPCVTRMLPGGGYVVRLYPAWTAFPSGDDTADTRRMLAFIEERVREMPEQYLWMHKRFKTRPEGEARFY